MPNWWGFHLWSLHKTLVSRFSWNSILFCFHFLRSHKHCLIFPLRLCKSLQKKKRILWMQTSLIISWCLMSPTRHSLSHLGIRVLTTLLILLLCFLTNSYLRIELCYSSMLMTYAYWKRYLVFPRKLFFEYSNEVDCDQ